MFADAVGAAWSSNCIYYTPNTTDGVKYTTNAVGNLSYAAIDRSFIYEYDKTGNISKITDKTGTTEKVSTYEYDGANQMNRENNPYSGQTVTYLYDEGGNIKAKNIYDYTTGSLDGLTPTVVNYTYGDAEWKDLLTSYNGVNITYDEIGNPKNYYNGMYFQWQNGRQLKSGTIWADELIMFAYQYNDAGIRTCKDTGDAVTDYFLDGSTIIAQKTGDNTIWYYYDNDGTREAMEYNGNVYYYFYNAQGDVMGLYDNNAQIVALYAYDSWGKVLSVTDKDGNAITDKTHVANVNPFRYRGYYDDEETGFYYLNSRYYDPETGRFLNADGFVSTGQGIFSNNMFAYCGNNPVNLVDYMGTCHGYPDSPNLNSPFSGVRYGYNCGNYGRHVRHPRKSPSSEQKSLTQDQKVLVATIAAEATVTANGSPVSSTGRQAMANVALNRVGSREWANFTTVAEICQFTGFDGYGNENYHACMAYLDTRDGSNAAYEAIIWDVMTAYNNDITDGCQLYYTPAAMSPAGSSPNWNFSILSEVTIPGVDPYYEGRFYKYR